MSAENCCYWRGYLDSSSYSGWSKPIVSLPLTSCVVMMTSSNGNIFRVTGQWRGALMFSFICVWINGCVNNRKAGDLRRYRAHYDVTVMYGIWSVITESVIMYARAIAYVTVQCHYHQYEGIQKKIGSGCWSDFLNIFVCINMLWLT